MTNPKLVAKKIERAKRIVARSIDTKPPTWALVWSQR